MALKKYFLLLFYIFCISFFFSTDLVQFSFQAAEGLSDAWLQCHAPSHQEAVASEWPANGDECLVINIHVYYSLALALNMCIYINIEATSKHWHLPVQTQLSVHEESLWLWMIWVQLWPEHFVGVHSFMMPNTKGTIFFSISCFLLMVWTSRVKSQEEEEIVCPLRQVHTGRKSRQNPCWLPNNTGLF